MFKTIPGLSTWRRGQTTAPKHTVGKRYKILVQRCDKLGDNVLILPIIASLHHQFPDAEIHILTSAVGKALFAHHPHVSTIHVYQLGRGPRHLWDYAKQLKSEGYTLYISVWNHPEMAWLGWLAAIPLRIGDASNPSLRWLYTHPVRQQWGNLTMHWASLNLSLLDPLHPYTKTALTDEDTPKIPYPAPVGIHGDPAVEARVAQQISDIRRKYPILILIFVGTGGTNFPIPETAILRLIVLLQSTQRYHIALCGQEAGDTLNRLTGPQITHLIGKTTLHELIAWIRNCDIYIGPDTGPTQMASMLGKPIVFFSPIKPNPPAYWGPLGTAFRIIREEYRCERFCAKEGCRSSCFDFLTGDRLYQELKDLETQLALHVEWSLPKRARVRIKHTLRLLLICHTAEAWESAMQTKASLEKQGIVSWVLLLKKPRLTHIFGLIRIIKARNINVIHAPFLPKTILYGIKLILGVWYVYPSPLHVPAGLIPDITEKALIGMYRDLWQI